jgi:hypothetical protein
VSQSSEICAAVRRQRFLAADHFGAKVVGRNLDLWVPFFELRKHGGDSFFDDW